MFKFFCCIFFRGFLDYLERVCKYWLDFVVNGKEDIILEILVINRVNVFIF